MSNAPLRPPESTQRIVLVRHGRPHVRFSERIPGYGFEDWLRRYDEAPLDPRVSPPRATVELAGTVAHVVTSDLRRSVETARAIAPDLAPPARAELREAGLSSPTFARPVLPAGLWGAMARVAWFAGWAPRSESIRDARGRAVSGALELSALAERHGSVLFVGHGILNAMIARSLRGAGWRGPRRPAGSFWAATEYRRG